MRKKLLAAAIWLVGFAALVLTIDWADYHTNGYSFTFGFNPRCIEHSTGQCYKLDMTNIPWDATAAIWLTHGVMAAMIVLYAVSAVTMAVSAVMLPITVAFPQDRSAGLLSRLADSSWLSLGTMGHGILVTLAVVGILHRMGHDILMVIMFPVGFMLSVFAGFKAESWAMHHRWARSDAYWANRAAEIEARQAAQEEADAD